MKALILACSLVSFALVGSAQTANSQWKNQLESELANFKDCMSTNNNDECRTVIGKSVEVVYGINDFYDSKTNSYKTANEIAASISTINNWTRIGYAYEQEALTQSQKLANQKKPVLAIYKNADGTSSHTVLVLPGELITSGSWNLKVPHAASFFTRDPGKSFIDKSLAYAFNKTMLLHVELYARK